MPERFGRWARRVPSVGRYHGRFSVIPANPILPSAFARVRNRVQKPHKSLSHSDTTREAAPCAPSSSAVDSRPGTGDRRTQERGAEDETPAAMVLGPQNRAPPVAAPVPLTSKNVTPVVTATENLSKIGRCVCPITNNLVQRQNEREGESSTQPPKNDRWP